MLALEDGQKSWQIPSVFFNCSRMSHRQDEWWLLTLYETKMRVAARDRFGLFIALGITFSEDSFDGVMYHIVQYQRIHILVDVRVCLSRVKDAGCCRSAAFGRSLVRHRPLAFFHIGVSDQSIV